jgi:hypothetical protein
MATRKKKAPARVEVPRRSADEITEEDCNAATTILEQDYYNDVRSAAREVAERLKSGDHGRESSEVISEVIDSTQRVIYTWQAKLGVIISKNGTYYLEEFGEEGVVENGDINWSRLCFVAMEQDVIEELDRRGVGLGEPHTWADIDMSEFD